MNLLINTPSLTVYEHMSLDEQLVHSNLQGTLLRFYNWTSGPAATFGYAQCCNEVKNVFASSHFMGEFTRRPTGGGIVFHQSDLTFSLIFTTKDSPTCIYQKFHHFIYQELQQIEGSLQLMHKVEPSAYAPSSHHVASACFIRPVENDLLSQTGSKILGGAIRRFNNKVLYQGSLQLPQARTNPRYKKIIIQAVRLFLGIDLVPTRIETRKMEQAQKSAQEIYKNTLWINKF